jgi:hypothetical protein
MAVVCYEYEKLAAEVIFLFCRVLLKVFPYPPSTDKLLSDFHVNRQGAPNYSVHFPFYDIFVHCANSRCETSDTICYFLYIFYKGEKCAKSVHPIDGKKNLMAHRMAPVPYIIEMSTTFLLYYLCLSALPNDVGDIGVRLVMAERASLR